MRRVLPATLVVLIMTVAANAQTVSTPQPRVLSTVPTPPDGAVPVPAQMSGMALQVGDLPPGIVSVRVIRGSFQNNVANQTVHLRVGSTDRVREAETGSDGRAQFSSLTVGDLVRVRARVDGEMLESQPFSIPSEGGVRLMLVAGTGAGVVNADPWPEASASGPVAASPVLPAAIDRRSPDAPTPVLAYVAFGGVVSLIAGAVVLWPRTRRRKSAVASTLISATPAVQTTARRRSDVFEQLVQLEKDYEAGRLTADVHATGREALIEEWLSFDAPVKDDAA